MAAPDPRTGKLTIRPLTAGRVDDVKTVTRGTWGAQCWDLFPRFTAAQERALGLAGGPATTNEARRRGVLAKLARRRRNAPGLVAYVDSDPVGWISLGPRSDFGRVAASKATPAVDQVPVWVIPCITVRRGHRGQGIAVALIRAAVAYAADRGAPAVEAYVRAGSARLHDDFAFFGTEPMFRTAGFRRVRGVLPGLPRGWAPRVTMRATCTTANPTSSRSPTRSRRAS